MENFYCHCIFHAGSLNQGSRKLGHEYSIVGGLLLLHDQEETILKAKPLAFWLVKGTWYIKIMRNHIIRWTSD